ncbi:hypothetical protein ES705_43967 [subsurface metagenome]
MKRNTKWGLCICSIRITDKLFGFAVSKEMGLCVYRKKMAKPCLLNLKTMICKMQVYQVFIEIGRGIYGLGLKMKVFIVMNWMGTISPLPGLIFQNRKKTLKPYPTIMLSLLLRIR